MLVHLRAPRRSTCPLCFAHGFESANLAETWRGQRDEGNVGHLALPFLAPDVPSSSSSQEPPLSPAPSHLHSKPPNTLAQRSRTKILEQSRNASAVIRCHGTAAGLPHNIKRKAKAQRWQRRMDSSETNTRVGGLRHRCSVSLLNKPRLAVGLGSLNKIPCHQSPIRPLGRLLIWVGFFK